MIRSNCVGCPGRPSECIYTVQVHTETPSHSHSGIHSHGHSHGGGGDWGEVRAKPILRLLLGVVAVAAIVTGIGLAVLWPDGQGRLAVLAEASEIGLLSDRITADVDEVIDDDCSFATENNEWDCRTLVVIPDSGPDAGQLLALPEFVRGPGLPVPDVEAGDRVIIDYEPTTGFYAFSDRDRRGPLLLLTLAFAALVMVLGRSQGVMALAAMITTVVILIAFVAGSVLDGNDPIAVCLVAASTIAFITLYLTHGFNPTTTTALIGTLLALCLTLAISSIFFALAGFTGLATEEGLVLPIIAGDIDLTGLLLGGAMISALGALDDVTVTQAATVAELHHRSPDLSRRQLFASGIRVGREHIGATVNTLLLAYAGVSLPLVLLFVVSNQSLALIANSELVAVEIVRTLCGSFGLIAAVPITTWLATMVASNDAIESVDPSNGPTVAPDEPVAEATEVSEATEEGSSAEPLVDDEPSITDDVELVADDGAVVDDSGFDQSDSSDADWEHFGPRDDVEPF